MTSQTTNLSPDTAQIQRSWLATLNTRKRNLRPEMRMTSIIGTIGPNTNSVDMLKKLRRKGLSIVRMNFSHGSYDYHQSVIDNTRKAEASEPGPLLAIALDTKGPEIRTGVTVDGKDYPMVKGSIVTFTTDEKYGEQCTSELLYVDYKNLCKVIEVGRIIYVDDGVLAFRVIEMTDDKTLKAECVNNGTISSRKGVNLPDTDIDLPALSEKDKADLQFGVKNKVDMIFASFIRSGHDIRQIRDILGPENKHIKIIAKIENQQGLNNFDDILRETDGVMVARGDLGIEIPVPAVFVAQKWMIAKCNLAGKPVICATQMLESMTYNPRPTRAEVSDVGNSILDGTDCVMLSGETAKGSYPLEAVECMANVCLESESTIAYGSLFNDLRLLAPRPLSMVETTCCSAIGATISYDAKAIICLSTSGTTARLCSKYRPTCPIIMVTRVPHFARQAYLMRGVFPLLYPYLIPTQNFDWQKDVDARVLWAVQEGIRNGLLAENDAIIIIQGWTKGSGHTSLIRVSTAHTTPDDY